MAEINEHTEKKKRNMLSDGEKKFRAQTMYHVHIEYMQ